MVPAAALLHASTKQANAVMSSEPREWFPTQEVQPQRVDLRHSKLGPRGYKLANKRTRDDLEQANEPDEAVGMDVEQVPAEQHSNKRVKGEDVVHRKLVGVYKEVAKPMYSLKKSISTTWAKKMEAKAARQQYLERKRAAVASYKEKRKAMAERRKQAKERKKANQQKSMVVQKVTNTATVKRMMKDKKQRKLLATADTN